MAELKKQYFGNLKGSFGKAVFRQRYGKNYISQKPSNYTPPLTDNYTMRITKFKVTSLISKTIYSNNELRSIWKNITSTKNFNTYNYLMSVIYPYVDGNSVNDNLKIVPNSNVGVRVDSITAQSDVININLLPLTEASLINPNIEKYARITSLIYLSNPVNTDVPQYDAVTISSNMLNINLNDSLSFDTLISTTNQLKLSNYQDKKLFSTLLTYDENNSLINYSSTFYSQLS